MEKSFMLIGEKLAHSYSKIFHEKFNDYEYDLCELPKDKLADFFLKRDFKGINVTIPYKVDAMKLVDSLDERAKEIGAINTVVNKNGKLIGYNTDFDGMVYALNRAGIEINGKCVMILGSGGTSNTAYHVAKTLGAKKIVKVSRTGDLNYNNYFNQVDTQVVINTTPVGMYPNTDNLIIDLHRLKNLEGVFDVVYNPFMTKLLLVAKSLNVKYSGGLSMLIAQAKYAHDLFTDKIYATSELEKLIRDFEKDNKNLVFIGMPGSGKSTIAKAVAQKLNREFIDTDKVIEERLGLTISEIFSKYGEEYFRKVESEVLYEVGKQIKKVIATGGGVVKDDKNYFYLKQNGKVIFVSREVNLLATSGRPLSKDLNAVKSLYEQRIDKYIAFKDFTIENNGSIDSAVKGVIEYYENFNN